MAKQNMVAYTVGEFNKKFRPSGFGTIKVGDAPDILYKEILCDICNKELVQPVGEPDKKVVWVDDRDAFCEKCKDDFAGKERLTRLIDTFKDGISRDNITDFIHKEIYDGIKNGWVRFKDGVNISADEWSLLSVDDKEKYPLALTDEGKKESSMLSSIIGIGNSEMKNGLSFSSLFDDVSIDANGNMVFKLNKDGILMEQFFRLSGGDFTEFMKKHFANGVDKLFNNFVIIDGAVTLGQFRFGMRGA